MESNCRDSGRTIDGAAVRLIRAVGRPPVPAFETLFDGVGVPSVEPP
jgi:hypothetical protein